MRKSCKNSQKSKSAVDSFDSVSVTLGTFLLSASSPRQFGVAPTPTVFDTLLSLKTVISAYLVCWHLRENKLNMAGLMNVYYTVSYRGGVMSPHPLRSRRLRVTTVRTAHRLRVWVPYCRNVYHRSVQSCFAGLMNGAGYALDTFRLVDDATFNTIIKPSSYCHHHDHHHHHHHQHRHCQPLRRLMLESLQRVEVSPESVGSVKRTRSPDICYHQHTTPWLTVQHNKYGHWLIDWVRVLRPNDMK